MALTKKQRRVMDYIGSFQELNGYSPSYEEIASGLGYRSKGTVHKHLKHLVEKGMITKQWNKSRSIDIIPPLEKSNAVSLPLLGLVAAGEPIAACPAARFIPRTASQTSVMSTSLVRNRTNLKNV